jgi:hypothetical protein
VLQTAGKAGKYAFGWDSDMTAYAPNAHLASAIINWAPYYINATQDMLDGTWKGEQRSWWGVKESAIDIVSISDKVPAEVKAKVEQVKAGLKDGSFVIWKGPITSNEGKEVLAGGTNADDKFLGGINFFVKGVERRSRAATKSDVRASAHVVSEAKEPSAPWRSTSTASRASGSRAAARAKAELHLHRGRARGPS